MSRSNIRCRGHKFICHHCSSVADTFPLEMQESEENFDLALVAALEIDVVPYLGDPSVSDYLITQVAKLLHQGSCLREVESFEPPSPPPTTDPKPGNNEKPDRHRKKMSKKRASVTESPTIDKFGAAESDIGTTDPGQFLPRERFSYWCFDLLFLVCSETSKGKSKGRIPSLSLSDLLYLSSRPDRIPARRRVAALCLPSLLERCRRTLVSYVSDEALRGNLPFPRLVLHNTQWAHMLTVTRPREEELLYVLRKLLALQLWPGTLWAALSDSPSRYSSEQPGTHLSSFTQAWSI